MPGKETKLPAASVCLVLSRDSPVHGTKGGHIHHLDQSETSPRHPGICAECMNMDLLTLSASSEETAGAPRSCSLRSYHQKETSLACGDLSCGVWIEGRRVERRMSLALLLLWCVELSSVL